MNKGRRQELKRLKFKKRLKIIGVNINDIKGREYCSFRNHGKPCSCWVCRDEKFRDGRNKKDRE